MERTCQFCQVTFDGRSNQEYCSNAHKAKAFRLRITKDQQRLASLEAPIFFLFNYPLSFLERNNPLLCQELNLIYNAIQLTKQPSYLEGYWENYSQLQSYVKDNLTFYRLQSRSMKEKVAQGEYSLRLQQFLGSNLLGIARLYSQVASQLGKVMRQYKKTDRLSEIEVKMDAVFMMKMNKLEAKYGKLWLIYQKMHS